MERTTPTFDDLRKTYELSSRIAHDMNDLASHDHAAASALVSQLAAIVGIGGNGSAVKTPEKRESPVFQKLAAVFVANGNSPLTKTQLAEAAGVTDGSVHTCVYTTKPKAFTRDVNPAYKRERVFRLTEEAYEEAKAGRHREGQ